MLNKLFKEGGLYTLASFLTKGISLILIPFYTNYFSTADYGVISMLGLFGAFSGAIVSLQVFRGMARIIAEENTSKYEQKVIGSTTFYFTCILFITFAVIGYTKRSFFIDILSSDVRIEEQTYLLALTVICVNFLFHTLGVQLKFLRKVKQFALISFLHSIFNIILIIFFALKLDLGINSIYIASLVISPIIILTQLIILKNYIGLHFDFKRLKQMLKFSLPLIPTGIIYLLLNFTDRLFIKEMLSMSDVGIYDLAFKFSAIISIVLYEFQSALAPVLYQNHKKLKTKVELVKIFNAFFGLGSLGVLILSLFSSETLLVFTNSAYYDAKDLMPIFYLTVLVSGLGMFSPGIFIKNKTKITPYIVAISAVINLSINYVMIKNFGLLGAALSTFISMLINNVILFIISQRYYKVPLRLKLIYKMLAYLTISIIVGSYIIYSFKLHLAIFITIKVCFILIYAFALYKNKLLNIKQFLKKDL